MNRKFQINEKALIAFIVFVGIVALVLYWRVGSEDVEGDYNIKTGNYRLEDGLFKEAVQEFTLALEKNPNHPAAHLGLGLAHMKMNEFDLALASFNRAIEIDPSLAIAYADRGILYDQLGEHENALKDYKKSLELDPKAVEIPGFLWRFMRNISEKPPGIKERAEYLEKELNKPEEERLLSAPEKDSQQRMHK